MAALPREGLLITVEPDAVAAAAAREALAAAGFSRQATVMIGDATRYLYKIAGPFDLIVLRGGAAPLPRLHGRIVERLRPSGVMVVSRLAEAGDYNDVLATDAQLITAFLEIDRGVAIAVKRQDVT